ncbi:hypothetical protein O3G_MSEX007743 [Manduca sexta]|uniref:Regulator of G-protein signaling 7 n=1 Tax=Manduca sexta TaxID=7130 RepID=A0A921Z7B2_MANSE|nr:hypothetical protein O3G_MSEX007743 [Manduca sexta]
MERDVSLVRRLSLCGIVGKPPKCEVSGAQRGRERHAAPAADAHGGRLAARAQPPRPQPPPRPTEAMELADVPRHRPLAFDKMESLIKEMQDPETGVPVRSQKLFLSVIPSAFMGYDLVEWLMERFNLDETSNVEAINLANQLCQYGYFFPVNDLKNLVLKDDSSLYRFQSPYYWPWQAPRVAGSGSGAPTLGPDNVEYAIYLVKRTLRNKQRHGLDEYEQEALANLRKNLSAKWDFITMQAEEQVRLAKERKKGDKIVSDSQERAYWRVARPPPGVPSALEPCPVPVRSRQPKPKKRTVQQLTREIEHLKASLDRTRVKTSIALEALLAYSETFAPYDPWLTPPQPSNPWVSDDTLFWQINSPLVEVPSEKRVQRWALSIEELVSDPTGLQEFTSFLRKEYSHENIRFWLAVMDLRRSSTKQIPKKLEEICEEFLKPGAPCEINIDGATAERVAEGLRTGSRYALDHAADHVYGLLLKKDCYPRFIRSDHFQRLLAEGRNIFQLRRSSEEEAGLDERDPLDDDTADVLPWECSSREGAYGARRRQDSAADSGSSSSDVSAAVCVAERTRRLPQQSTLDGGLRGAPPPLRRLSAVEPRHLAPLASPPHSPRPPRPAPAPRPAPQAPPHPTPTISVSSAPDDESADSPPCTGSPEEPRSVAHSDEPSSVFASADATPTEPSRPPMRLVDGCFSPPEVTYEETANVSAAADVRSQAANESATVVPSEDSCDDSTASAAVSDRRESDRTRSSEDEVDSLRRTVSREASITKEVAPLAKLAISDKVNDNATNVDTEDTASHLIQAPEQVAASENVAIEVVAVSENVQSVPAATCAAAECEPAPAAPSLADCVAWKLPVVPLVPAMPVMPVVPAVPLVPVAPLAVCEDIGVDDDHVDKVPSTPPQRVSESGAPAATQTIAHSDELTSGSHSDIVKRDNKSGIGERKQRNDICPWEDE